MPGSEAERLHLLLASAAGPVAVDALAASNLWRPSVLLAAIEDGRRSGVLGADDSRERLVWLGDGDAVVARAKPEDLDALATTATSLEVLLAGARQAARERRFGKAEALYRCLGRIEPAARRLLPGGQSIWVAMVLEATRLFRTTWIVGPDRLDAAIELSENRGDLQSQAVLLASRGVQALATDPEAARRLFDRASEACEAVGSPSIRAEVKAYIAVSLVLSGRPAEGVAAFEALLGDVQPDLFAPTEGMPLDLEGVVPASAQSILVFAYASIGELPRAADLIRRLVARGVETNNSALEAQGQLMLAAGFMLEGDRASAASCAAAAAPWFADVNSPYAWLCALTRAWSVAEDRPGEAREILAAALPVWRATGGRWTGGSRWLELLQKLAGAEVAPLDGVTLEGEVRRHLQVPEPLLAGTAHRWAAKLATSPELRAHHLGEAVRLLREAGARPELELALREAAAAGSGGGPAWEALRAAMEVGDSPPPGAAQAVRLATTVLELGRLGSLGPPREGLWGEVSARLCRELGAERCAILLLDVAGAASFLSARGAPAWREAVAARVAGGPPQGPVFGPALSPGPPDRAGQLILVPFSDSGNRRGVVALENADTTPRVGPADSVLLSLLGSQIAILLANLALWRELQEARQSLEQENRYYREAGPSAPAREGRFVGDSPAMRKVLELVQRVAPSTTPVLVTGETGVGKELVSREVHLASRRRDGPFIAVHVASLSPGIVASALFGHERGAFTGATEQVKGRFELANGGTLFLDEVGELSPDDQIRLLRVLQEGTFERVGGSRPLRSEFRLVAATNRDLTAEVRAGRFREDLYFRLAAFPIQVPPLRERREEIPSLALFFMERAARKLGVEFEGISERDMERLTQYGWPGNVRELEHVIERAALLSDPPRLRIPPLEGAGAAARAPVSAEEASAREEWVSLEEIERRYVRRVLHHVGGRVSGPGGAAEILQLKPSTLHFRIDRLGLRGELAKARRSRS